VVHFTLNSTLYRCEKVLLQTIALYTVIITILRYLFYKKEKDLLDKRKFDRIFRSSEEKYTNLCGPPCYLSFFLLETISFHKEKNTRASVYAASK